MHFTTHVPNHHWDRTRYIIFNSFHVYTYKPKMPHVLYMAISTGVKKNILVSISCVSLGRISGWNQLFVWHVVHLHITMCKGAWGCNYIFVTSLFGCTFHAFLWLDIPDEIYYLFGMLGMFSYFWSKGYKTFWYW